MKVLLLLLFVPHVRLSKEPQLSDWEETTGHPCRSVDLDVSRSLKFLFQKTKKNRVRWVSSYWSVCQLLNQQAA